MNSFLNLIFGKLVFIVIVAFVTFIFIQRSEIVKELGLLNMESKNSVTKVIIDENYKKEIVSEKIEEKKAESVTLNSARKLYWNNDVKGSISKYEVLINKNPLDIDLHGELADLYFGQKDFKNATIKYHTVAKLLIDNNSIFRAKQIIQVLYTLNQVKAKDVEAYLNQHKNN